MTIRLEHLHKTFGAQTIVNDVSLTIETGEMFFLLGPSGCGKTTLLRMLAGFYPPDQGRIFFGDQDVTTSPPQKRNTALVFQQYALWPHLTVFENVAYGLRVRQVAEPELRSRVLKALQQVRMEALADRKPTQLSGGQQQRVALARAMVVKPDLLLFDEPLSNLDAKLRLEMREEIQRLHAQDGFTSLYVTHDQEEALSLASRIGVMHQGQLQQVGTPRDLYENPKTAFVASFMGEINLIKTDNPLAVSLLKNPRSEIQNPQRLGFRPQHVEVGSGPTQATVKTCTYLGSKVEMLLVTGTGEEIKAWTSEPAAVGTQVLFGVAEKNLRLLVE
jgi:ABC-type Fe3+/spermidine/putrescine transport system ATPase subunit